MHFIDKDPSQKRKDFVKKLKTNKILRVPGAYNPLTAKLIEKIGYDAVYVSGGVMANDLGFPDIGLTTLQDVSTRSYLISRVTNLPTIVDIDTGFKSCSETIKTFEELVAWQRAKRLRKSLSIFCETLPANELYRLKDQILRASQSVTANIAPKLCSDMQKFSKSKRDNEIMEAERIDSILQPVHKALFIESNPAPVKYAAKLLGLCDDAVRLPLVSIMEETKLKVKNSLSVS